MGALLAELHDLRVEGGPPARRVSLEESEVELQPAVIVEACLLHAQRTVAIKDEGRLGYDRAQLVRGEPGTAAVDPELAQSVPPPEAHGEG